MDQQLSLALSLAAACSVLMIMSGARLASARQDVVRSRLDQIAARPRTLEELELSQPFYDRVIKPALQSVSNLFSRRRPEAAVREVRRRLALAGNPNNMDAADFIGLKGLVAVALAGLTGLVLYFTMGFLQVIVGAIVAGGIGYFLPDLWLSRLIKERQREITKALPDALDLLTISVEAGLGFDAAMNKVAQKWQGALSQEFGRVLSEIRMGKSRREALRDMASRTDVPDVNTFVAAIIQADQLGVSIAKVLQIQSEQMRVRRRQRAEEEAHKAPIKMTFPLVFLIFPAMLIVLLGPALVQIFEMFTSGAL